MEDKAEEDLKIWDMVHDWCDGIYQDIQVAYIPDMAKRHLMDLIKSYAKEHAKQAWQNGKASLIYEESIRPTFEGWYTEWIKDKE